MTPIKDQTKTILQILSDPTTQGTFIDASKKGWTLIKHVLHLLWLSLCVIYVLLAWLVQKERAAQTAYQSWYQQTAPQENLAAEFVKAAWALLARTANSIRNYAEDFLDQYQGQQVEDKAGDPAPMLAAPTITPMTVAPLTAAP